MEQTLKLFTTTDLRSASLGLLDKLGLKYAVGAKMQLDIHKLFRNMQLSKATEEAMEIVSGTYFIAQIDNRSFIDSSQTIDLDTALQ